MKRESCINTWPKGLLYFRAFFQSCKCIANFCSYNLKKNRKLIFKTFESKYARFDMIHSHSLLDQKINNVLSISNDQAILKAIQSIIQNMLATEDPSQQQLHFLQSCGFGGLWRFAGPFTKTSVSKKQMTRRIFIQSENDLILNEFHIFCSTI